MGRGESRSVAALAIFSGWFGRPTNSENTADYGTLLERGLLLRLEAEPSSDSVVMPAIDILLSVILRLRFILLSCVFRISL